MPNPCYYCGVTASLPSQHREECPNKLVVWGSSGAREKALALFEKGYKDGARSAVDDNHPKSDEISYHLGWNKARKERGIHGIAVIVVPPF